MTNCIVLAIFPAFCQGPPDSCQGRAPNVCPDGVQAYTAIPRNAIPKVGSDIEGGGRECRDNKSNTSQGARERSHSSFPPLFLLAHQKGSRALYWFSVSTFLARALYHK